MRRITLWITATAVVVALVIAYQINRTGGGDKGGGEHDAPGPVATCTTGTPCPTPSPTGSRADDRGTNDQTGKPGEHK